MKRMLLVAALTLAAGAPALAADLPPPVAPPPQAPATYVPMAAPIFSWTGFYLGINGGYGFGTGDFSSGTSVSSVDGFLVGGTVGANYQMGSFVVGVEGDLDWNDIDGTNSTTCNPGAGGCEVKSNWLGTGRVRAGWAWDRILFYGTGGAAFGNVEGGNIGGPFDSGTQVGWTAGAGIEGALTPNWTARVEYLYVDLGNFTCTANCLGGGTLNLTENVIRVGVDYKFGW